MKKRVFMLLAGLALLSSCTNNELEKQLVGTWQEINNPKGALIFNSDHNGHAYWPDETGAQQGSAMRWQLVKNQNKVSVITPPGPVDFEIRDNRLVSPNGVVLTKVK